MLKSIINLTPHAITIVMESGNIVVPPSGVVARRSENTVTIGMVEGIPIVKKVFGVVENLPDPVEGIIYITSALVGAEVKRADVMSPGDPVRDEHGRVIGCKTLCSF